MIAMDTVVEAHASRPAGAEAVDLIGRWEGALSIGQTSLPLVVRVEPGPGGITAALDSPTQGAVGIPVTDLTVTAGVVRFAVPSLSGRFEGAVSADGGTWTGIWSQGPGSLPLILNRAESAAEPVAERPARPQTPVPPFPYGAADVTFRNAGAGIDLTGTLTLPQGTGPFPAAVLLTGSGAQDRDETILGHKPFAVWADALTRRGVAVLRYDDRGVGGSGGGGPDETTADFATDAAAAVAFLQDRPEIDPTRIGLVGHSEGGTTALIASATGVPAAFIVLIAGPAVTGAEIVTEQVAQIAAAAGATPDQIADARRTQGAVMAAVVENRNDGAAAARAVEAVLTAAGQNPEQARAGIAALSSGWYRYLAAYDPAPALAAVRVPLLAVYGGMDLQVPADQNREALARLKPDADIVVLPGLNHLMQTATTGLPSEYGTISETLAPEALATVTDWVVRTTGAR
ncbi:MAG: alpha/beta hydrolase [Brevundimonas sp.]|uniref:alpha/beta hydrolase family protein n=1 Tax=Brevundimonas sp. TaxID=1871086 RepID=UPI00273618CF|nr:alpha/beta hydrolase [Brevundimonas sp.]MDP3405021.1 alpha/beta hydrolase [Brevundimonas sp.]